MEQSITIIHLLLYPVDSVQFYQVIRFLLYNIVSVFFLPHWRGSAIEDLVHTVSVESGGHSEKAKLFPG